ncbi:MAG: recombinase family protein [Actinobacteria bacterium]|nr:recombinase family protein [Actinomycetota bacterium]MBL7197293.1 recombinase family protein [Candidatus Omnitrophota bacterium]
MQIKTRCAIYTRVSTDNQAEVEFNSCEAQKEKIISFIKSQENMEVFKVYSDPGFTGANTNRPALLSMIQDIKQNKINLVISYKIDRLTRSPKDFYQLIELFERYSVDFISVTERFDTSTPSGRLLRNIMLTFSQFERELTSERTKDKMLQRAQKGMWNGGIIPFGYKTADKKLIIDKERAEIVHDIYESYITNRSIAKIYNNLKTDNIKANNRLLLSKSRIYNILRNPVYTGKIKYDSELSKGNHKPIISEDIFNIAQKIHKKRVKKLHLHKKRTLTGLIKCKECGSFMTPCHTNKKRQGKTKRYYYYRCTSTFKKEWNNCNTRQVSANRLDDYIFENLKRISRDKHYIDSLIFRLNHSPSVGRTRLEPSQTLSDSLNISPEIFLETLQNFTDILPEKKVIEKSLWVKKFIKRVDYSRDGIAVSLYCKGLGDTDHGISASGRAEENAGRNSDMIDLKRGPVMNSGSSNHQIWLPGLVNVDNN